MSTTPTPSATASRLLRADEDGSVYWDRSDAPSLEHHFHVVFHAQDKISLQSEYRGTWLAVKPDTSVSFHKADRCFDLGTKCIFTVSPWITLK